MQFSLRLDCGCKIPGSPLNIEMSVRLRPCCLGKNHSGAVDKNAQGAWFEVPAALKKYRVTYCTRTSPLPLLPSGPGGIGGITSRRTRH